MLHGRAAAKHGHQRESPQTAATNRKTEKGATIKEKRDAALHRNAKRGNPII
jgi:hypothetical protein